MSLYGSIISHGWNFSLIRQNTILTREALEAELDTIDQKGYSTEFEEIGLGISCVAVPILKEDNTLFGTVSIIASSSVIMSVLDTALEPLHSRRVHSREYPPLRMLVSYVIRLYIKLSVAYNDNLHASRTGHRHQSKKGSILNVGVC